MAKLIKIPRKEIKIKKSRLKYSREDLLFFGAHLWPISSDSWRRLRGIPSASTVRKIFGSWENFREEIKDGFEGDGIEIKMMDEERKPYRFYSNKSDEELKSYTRENYKDLQLWNLFKEDSGLYNVLRERKLLESLVEEGTLIRKRLEDIVSEKLGMPIESEKRLREIVLERYVSLFWDNLLRDEDSIRFKEKTLSVFLINRDFLTGDYKEDKGSLNFLYHRYIRSEERQQGTSLFDYMTQGLDSELVERARKIDSGERLREIAVGWYVGSFYDNLLRDKDSTYFKEKTLSVFLINRDFLTGDYKEDKGSLEFLYQRYIRSEERQQGTSLFDYMTQGLNPELVEKARKIDSGERVREIAVGWYVGSFYDNPIRDKVFTNFREKTLSAFLKTRDFLTGDHLGENKGPLQFLYNRYVHSEERQQGTSLFDYMTQGLNPELVEKARKIDSGERVDEYLAEQLGENIDRYLTSIE